MEWGVGTRTSQSLETASVASYKRRMKRGSFIPLLLVATIFGAVSAQAGSVREQQAMAAWRKQDECARAAFVKFPDYVPESNAKRAEATRQCERDNRLPERLPANESPIKTIPDDEAN
jgi:hypothetical protein